MVMGQKDEAVAAQVRTTLGEGWDILFSSEEPSARKPSRYILPFLSCHGMAELATGKAGEPVLAAVLRLLLSGTGVEVLQFEYRSYKQTAPDALYALYTSYEATLARYGLTEYVQPGPSEVWFREQLVTEKAVAQLHQAGALTVWVPLTAVVTPLAADAAKNLKMNIVKRH